MVHLGTGGYASGSSSTGTTSGGTRKGRGKPLVSPLIPPPEIHVAPGSKESGFMAVADVVARFPLPAEMVFAITSHPRRQYAYSNVIDQTRKEIQVPVSGPSGGAGEQGRVPGSHLYIYEDTLVGEIPFLWHRLRISTSFHVEDDTRTDPRVLVSRCRLMHGDMLQVFEAVCTVRQESGPGQGEQAGGAPREEEEGAESAAGAAARTEGAAPQPQAWCSVHMRQSMAPRLPSFLRGVASRMVRSAFEAEMAQWHADVSALVTQVLAGRSVDEAVEAVRQERLAAR